MAGRSSKVRHGLYAAFTYCCMRTGTHLTGSSHHDSDDMYMTCATHVFNTSTGANCTRQHGAGLSMCVYFFQLTLPLVMSCLCRAVAVCPASPTGWCCRQGCAPLPAHCQPGRQPPPCAACAQLQRHQRRSARRKCTGTTGEPHTVG